MIPPKKKALLGITLLALGSCTGDAPPAREPPGDGSIDERSYNLGAIGAFSEMVGAGVKELALSAPLEIDRMDSLLTDALRIADDHGVEVFREKEFMVTDLFSPELTEGKEVLLIYRGETLARYLALKAEKERLLAEGQYDGAARTDLARRFGKLLSYSEEKIQALLGAGEDA